MDSGWEFGITGYARDEVVAVLRLDVDAVGDVTVEFAALMYLVRLHDEAVVVSAPFCVVTRRGVDADGLEARSIVVGCERIVVGRRGVRTSRDFKFVADAVAVGVAKARTVAVVAVVGIGTRTVVVGRVCVVVAGCIVSTSSDFKFVANAVTVGIVQANPIAVVAGFWSVSFAVARAFSDAIASAHSALVELEARTVIVGCFCVVVTGRSIGASRNFEFVAYAITVGISQAVAIAVVACFRSVSFAVARAFRDARASAHSALIELEARTVVVGSRSVVVARRGIGASGQFKLVAHTIAVGIHEAVAFAVVASISVGARSVFVCGVCVVVTRRGVLTSCDFKFVAYTVFVGVHEAVSVAVVAGIGVGARSVAICSIGVVVARFGVLTTSDFKLVAHTVAVGIVEAISVAVIAGFWSVSFAVACAFRDAIASAYAALVELEARAVIIGCFGVVVARLRIGTACDFELVADSVAVCVIEARAFAVVSFVGVFTRLGSTWCYASVFEVEEDAVVVVRISVDEDLHVQRSGEHAVGGDLSEEYLLVVSSYAVGVSVEDEPTASDGVIDGEVTTCFEVVAPWVEGRSDGVDVSFTSCCCFRQANGYIRVVRCLWEETEEGRCLV